MTKIEPPQPLTQGYRKARRAYGIVAGLLLAWELIGINLASDPVGPVPITLKSPEAAPFVLLALVIYFGVRLTLEWYQCHTARRETLPAKFDFFLAHLIGVCALSAFVIQRLIDAQLYDLLKPQLAPASVGILSSAAMLNVLVDWFEDLPGMKKPVIITGTLAVLSLFVNWGLDVAPFLVLLLWGLGGIVLGVIIYLSAKFRLYDYFMPSIIGADQVLNLLNQFRSIREEKS